MSIFSFSSSPSLLLSIYSFSSAVLALPFTNKVMNLTNEQCMFKTNEMLLFPVRLLITFSILTVCRAQDTCGGDLGNGKCRSKCNVWETEADDECGAHCKCCLPLIDGKHLCRLGSTGKFIIFCYV